MAEALEKVRILEQLQTQRHSNSSLDLAHTLPVATQGSGESPGSSCSSGGDRDLANRSNQWRKSKGSGGGSGGDEDDYEDEDKTPTPPPSPHSRQSLRMAATSPSHSLNLSQQPKPSYLQPPYMTPLSAKNNRYLLHPDVMHQHFPSEVSVLPVPHILCPSNTGGGGSGDAMSLAAMLGDDCTVDENVFLADMIALKYLGLSRNHAGIDQTESQQLGYGGYCILGCCISP